MSFLRSRRMRGAAVALAAGSLILTGCSGGGGQDKSPGKDTDFGDIEAQSQPVTYADAAASQGPADEVEGSSKGGTVRVYQQTDFTHLDPGQIYVSDAGNLAVLIHRGLTATKENDDGSKTIVGDLATSAGEVSDGGKTWTYTLKDGVKDQDGDTITSADVRHTFERLYAEVIFDGPTFIQKWLSGDDYRKALPDGPYKGDHLPDSVIETPDDKTIVFKFDAPQNDLPQALAMAGYAIVPEDDDTQKKYDQNPKALGPYKIGDYKPGKSMTLVRNEHWDAETDPIRRAYPDKWKFTFNHDDADQTRRILADKGEAQRALQFSGAVSAAQLRDVVTNAKDRSVAGYQPYVWQLNMNMKRIEDKKVRDAITYALPGPAIFAPEGGEYAGATAGNLFAPTLPGHEPEYDPYGRLDNPKGQPEKARKLLKEAGKENMELVYAFANTDIRQKQSVVIAKALEEAGFNVQKKAVNSQTWYEQMGKVDNPFHVYMTGWGQDWSSPSTVIPPVYDGDVIADGASNYSHIDDPKTNKEIDRILKIKDPEKANEEWVKLHHHIVENVNPAVPLYYTKTIQIHGSKIGGAKFSTVRSYINVNQVYVKQ
ncbi:ABC transporter substrate-binding protein [Streptomyces sp. RKND-216]|uniref:ABC transporter substrate-binding protein n=1 Tax=Streptomyces sp. RKND-216 TaxID=2562581 RepID=UPI00109DAAD8|nr:ABC transporter substrate-binding protein [Streptomyces sp. RKND-216]THA24679.1 ABC transporter substrate-binding protein [Streptomyces sp. RKND-216]